MPASQESQVHLETAHILFLDVVGYSKLLVNEQREVLQQLNEAVRGAPQFRKSSAAGKLIRIPTGDGMALVFFQSPEQPVHCAMEIAKALKNYPHIRLRMGVHSGPVDQVTDVNDQTNVAGAGINFAQRVMDCGDAGHILISKRVADDLAQDRLWQPLLHELGEIEVKHGVKLGIVNLYTAELGNPHSPQKLSPQAGAAKQPIASFKTESVVPEKSIAVLPFENLSAEQENAFFTDGVQDEILTNLAKIADLKVISRTSVLQYKTGMKRNLREIANALGVAHVVEGTVQRAGNRVRVSAQLIDARSDTHLWGEHYHRSLDDVFAIQSEIAKAVADELQAKLSPAEKAAIEQKPTDDLAAYDRYIRAKALLTGTSNLDSRLGDNLFQAVRLLSQAIARDPNFLLAYCQLAWAHDQLYFFGFDHTAARLALANEALERAMQLGPDRGEAHLAAAWIYYQCYLDYDRARAELDLARRTLPNEPFVFALAGYIDRRQGRWKEHISNFERALEIDPRNVFILQQLSQSYKNLRRFTEMGDVLDRTLAIIPADAMMRVARAFVDLDARADTASLRATINNVVTEDPNAGEAIADLWFHFALCEGDAAEVTRALAFISPEGDTLSNVRMPQNVFQGIAARARGDSVTARTAFTATRAEMEKIVMEQPDYAEALCMLGLIDAGLGRKEEALTEGRRAVELLPLTKNAITGAELMMFLAIIYAWTGEKDLALKELTSLLEIPDPHLSYGQLRLHPYWDPLRGDPRFDKIVEESKKPVALK
jgi:TolB-like protein/Tfp pilus assembly protein PilF